MEERFDLSTKGVPNCSLNYDGLIMLGEHYKRKHPSFSSSRILHLSLDDFMDIKEIEVETIFLIHTNTITSSDRRIKHEIMVYINPQDHVGYVRLFAKPI